MNKIFSKYLALLLSLIIFLCGCVSGNLNTDNTESSNDNNTVQTTVVEDGTYTSKDQVADYIVEFGHLPKNFITKKEAKKLGWIPKEGNLQEVAPGMSIGGDRFNNYEKSLPEEDKYIECDIDYDGGKRGSKRIVYSEKNVYYTDDHYKTFTKIR